MIRQFFFLGGERIDDLYCLRQKFKKEPAKQEALMAELMSKYVSGLFTSWLKNQIYDMTRDADAVEKAHFKALRNQWLDIADPDERQKILALLCELCDVKVELNLSEQSEMEKKKRAKLSVFSWYKHDPMENVANWDYVVLEASELKSTMGSLLLSDEKDKVIHLCNTGEDPYDLKGMKLPGVRIVGHGRPVCILSDPKLNGMAELNLEKMPGMVLEGIILQGKCSLAGINERNWKNCSYKREGVEE